MQCCRERSDLAAADRAGSRLRRCWGLEWPWHRAACEAETAGLKALARGVQLDITAPADLRSGGAVHVAWRAASRFPPKTPVFVVVAIPGEVRIEAPPLPKPAQDSKPDQADNAAPDLPGVLALPGAARAPLDLAFGAGKTRLLVPLYQPGSKLAGSVDVRVFDAGALALEAVVVAKTACGERSLGETIRREIDVAPGAPEIVVQDPFDIDVPKRIVISNSGRYRLHVFEGRYRVFELATGAKLVDRAGHSPNFSPTSRFVVADVGDADGRELEVIDLVSQQVIHTAAGPFVGWANGDAFLIDGTSQYGGLSVRPSLISRPVATAGDDPQDKPERRPGSQCARLLPRLLVVDRLAHDARSRQRHRRVPRHLRRWHRRGLRAGLRLQGLLRDAEVAAAFPVRPARTPMRRLKQFVAATYEVRPVEWKPGWNVRDGLAFSHIYDPLAKPDPRLADQEWYKAAIPLRQQLTLHRALEAQAQSPRRASPASPRASCCAATGARARGARARPAEASAREGLLTELSRFGVDAAPPLAREAIPFSNSPASEDAKGRYDTENKKLEAEIDKRSKALERRLLADVPALKPHLGQRKVGELPAFPYDGDLTQGKIILSDQMEGLWRWQVDGNPLWLMQLLTIEGSGAFGQGAIFLLEGQKKAAGRVTNLSKALEGLWGGQYGSTAQQTRLKPQLFFGRYLVIASVATRNIGIYDIKSGQKVAMIAGMPQADLLEDVLLSVDRRHVIQLNSDGQFFLHEIATGRMALSGRYVDGEIILYTPGGLLLVVLRGRALRAAAVSRIAGALLLPAVRRRAQPSRGDQGQARGRERRHAAAARASAGGGSAAGRGAGWRRADACWFRRDPAKGSPACGSIRTAS